MMLTLSFIACSPTFIESRYEHMPEVRRIAKHRHVPHIIKKAAEAERVQRDKERRKVTSLPAFVCVCVVVACDPGLCVSRAEDVVLVLPVHVIESLHSIHATGYRVLHDGTLCYLVHVVP